MTSQPNRKSVREIAMPLRTQLSPKFLAVLAFSLFTIMALAQVEAPLAPDLQQKIDRVAEDVLQTTGVPSASVAIVKDGKIAFLQAYGKARLEPAVPARPEMRYAVGSISKQFTASAILLLQEKASFRSTTKSQSLSRI
jgi:D-alanyl-D-alanine carboxypeptidase